MQLYDTVSSPFLDLRSPLTAWEWVKLLLLAPTVPLRLIAIFWVIVSVAVVNTLAISGCSLDRPLPRWRRRLVEVSSSTASGAVLRLVGFRLSTKGLTNLRAGEQMGAVAVLAPHVSYLDAWVIVWAWCASGITFAYTADLPILGRGIRALQNLYLPREGDSQQRAGRMVELIKQRVADRGMPILSVAPEGTLGNGRCLLQFKRGAFVPGAPVVPVLMRYRLEPFNPSWGIINEPWHLLRMMCQLGTNAVCVEFLPPYTPSPAEAADPGLYAANVRRLMADALGVPLVEQDRSTYLALVNARVGVDLAGRRVTAPPSLLDASGRFDIEPFLPANFAKARRATLEQGQGRGQQNAAGSEAAAKKAA